MTNLNPFDMEGSDSYNERLTHAIQFHMDGVAGNVAAVQEAHRLLEQLRADYPANPLVDAYYGSAIILMARDKTKALEKLKWSNQGLKILDNAVAADPHDSTIRLLRGKAAYNLPEKYFQRAKTVIEDYTFLLNKQDDILDTDGRSQLIYELGDAYARIGRNEDAATYFRSLENQTQNSAWHQLSTQKLQALEGRPALENIPNENPTSMLIEATRSVGSALLTWADEEKNKGIAQQKVKERAKERALQKAKEEAKERAKENARKLAREKAEELAKERALEKEREIALEKERQNALEKERQIALERERQIALEKEREMAALEKSKARTAPKAKLIAKPKAKPRLKQKAKPITQQRSKPKLKPKLKPKARTKPMTNLKNKTK